MTGTVIETATPLGAPIGSPVTLSTIPNIDGKTIGSTLVYTVPVGKTAIIISARVRCAVASSITIGPACSVGSSPGATDIFASIAINALTASPKLYGFVLFGMSTSVPAGGNIYFNVDIAATGTSQALTVDVVGYLV